MVSHQTSTTGTGAATKPQYGTTDVVEQAARRIDEPVKRRTGVSIFHVLTLASIGASISLFLAGRKDLAIFIGLWPPTFQALKAASESRQERELSYGQ